MLGCETVRRLTAWQYGACSSLRNGLPGTTHLPHTNQEPQAAVLALHLQAPLLVFVCCCSAQASRSPQVRPPRGFIDFDCRYVRGDHATPEG